MNQLSIEGCRILRSGIDAKGNKFWIVEDHQNGGTKYIKETEPRFALRDIVKRAGSTGIDDLKIYEKMKEMTDLDRKEVDKLLVKERDSYDTMHEDYYGKWKMND